MEITQEERVRARILFRIVTQNNGVKLTLKTLFKIENMGFNLIPSVNFHQPTTQSPTEYYWNSSDS